MLANAITGKAEINPSFIGILKELSPVEVYLLDQLFDVANRETAYKKRVKLQFKREFLIDNFNLTKEKTDLVLENLFRLNLCRPPSSAGGAKIGKYDFAISTTKIFEFTTLGYNFVKACKWERGRRQ